MAINSISTLLKITLFLLTAILVQGKPIGIQQRDEQFLTLGAVQFRQSSYLFYTTGDGNLAYLKSVKQREHPKAPDYQTNTLLIDGDPVQVTQNNGIPVVTALRYEVDGGENLRVYYVDPDGILSEAGQDGSGDWFNGSLNDQNYQVAPGSGITASILHPDSQLKVYYYSIDTPDQISVAYITASQGHWETRTITPPSSM